MTLSMDLPEKDLVSMLKSGVAKANQYVKQLAERPIAELTHEQRKELLEFHDNCLKANNTLPEWLSKWRVMYIWWTMPPEIKKIIFDYLPDANDILHASLIDKSTLLPARQALFYSNTQLADTYASRLFCAPLQLRLPASQTVLNHQIPRLFNHNQAPLWLHKDKLEHDFEQGSGLNDHAYTMANFIGYEPEIYAQYLPIIVKGLVKQGNRDAAILIESALYTKIQSIQDVDDFHFNPLVRSYSECYKLIPLLPTETSRNNQLTNVLTKLMENCFSHKHVQWQLLADMLPLTSDKKVQKQYIHDMIKYLRSDDHYLWQDYTLNILMQNISLLSKDQRNWLFDRVIDVANDTVDVSTLYGRQEALKPDTYRLNKLRPYVNILDTKQKKMLFKGLCYWSLSQESVDFALALFQGFNSKQRENRLKEIDVFLGNKKNIYSHVNFMVLIMKIKLLNYLSVKQKNELTQFFINIALYTNGIKHNQFQDAFKMYLDLIDEVEKNKILNALHGNNLQIQFTYDRITVEIKKLMDIYDENKYTDMHPIELVAKHAKQFGPQVPIALFNMAKNNLEGELANDPDAKVVALKILPQIFNDFDDKHKNSAYVLILSAMNIPIPYQQSVDFDNQEDEYLTVQQKEIKRRAKQIVKQGLESLAAIFPNLPEGLFQKACNALINLVEPYPGKKIAYQQRVWVAKAFLPVLVKRKLPKEVLHLLKDCLQAKYFQHQEVIFVDLVKAVFYQIDDTAERREWLKRLVDPALKYCPRNYLCQTIMQLYPLIGDMTADFAPPVTFGFDKMRQSTSTSTSTVTTTGKVDELADELEVKSTVTATR